MNFINWNWKVFVSLLSSSHLVNNVEVWLHFCVLRHNVSTMLLMKSGSVGESIVDILSEVLELLKIYVNLWVESVSFLYWVPDLLEFIQFILVSLNWSALAFSIEPIDCFLQFLHQLFSDSRIDVLLIGTIAINIVFKLVWVSLKFILGSFVVKNLVILREPSIFLSGEMGSYILRQGMWLSIDSDRACCLLVLFTDLILLLGSFRLLLLFLFHLSIGRFLLSCLRSTLLFRGLSWLWWCRDIFFNRNLFFFNPFLLEVGRLKARYLMNVVADSQNEGNFLIVFGFTFFDSVLCDFFREALNQLNTIRVVDEEIH